jgi:deoxyribodipyrimidine photo-lyase
VAECCPRLKTILHWFRRDLRISDNTALHEAWSRGDRLIPVFCWDDAFLTGPDAGPAQVAFLLRSLESLSNNLAQLGHRLILRHGPPHLEIPRLAREVGATAVFANRDYGPLERERDARTRTALESVGIGFQSFKDSVIWEEMEILTGTGGIYTVFTPYSKSWKARPWPGPRPRIGPPKQPVPVSTPSLPIGTDPAELGHPLTQSIFPAGERAARQALDAFVESHIFNYAHGRDFPASDNGTSRLSPHLRFGTINIRTVLKVLTQARARATSPTQEKGCDIWLSELIWREFYMQVLANHPHVVRGCFRPEYDRLEWEGKDAWFDAWCAGQTGYPIVDAAMRCLNATGWMHNRLRMIVAMFLTKDLLIHWQRGERYFMRQLVDGDLAANNGGWQWSSGTGTDAAPYFRIFNPVSQAEKFDPDARFVRTWVPELRDVPDNTVHSPWEDPLWLTRSGYARPIVDHSVQRNRCLAMFKKVKGSNPG